MSKADAYFEKEQVFKEGLAKLRELALSTEMDETVKWGIPVYTIGNKNVVGISAFKNHFGLWFFNGVFLSDPENVLQNAQEGKTKAMRQWRFTSTDQIDSELVREYFKEAIENQKKGLSVKPEKKSTVIPELLQTALNNSADLTSRFKGLTPYKQREYCEYISSAKQEKTKLSRLEKILPMIEKGLGMNDKYRSS